jgi:hypothetical protein
MPEFLTLQPPEQSFTLLLNNLPEFHPGIEVVPVVTALNRVLLRRSIPRKTARRSTAARSMGMR